MKNSIVISFLLLSIIAGSCITSKPEVTADFLEASRFHERIAILPFIVDFNEEYKINTMRQSSKTREEGYWEKTSMFAGMDMQKTLFQDMAKQVQKGRYELVIQDFLTTNRTLEEASVPYRGLSVLDKGLIAKQLGVDAILFGESFVDVNIRSFRPGGVTTKLSLFDARTGQILWVKEVTQQPSSAMDTPVRIASQTVSQLAKRLPYQNR